MTGARHLVDQLGLDFDLAERNLGATFIQEDRAELTENEPDFVEASIRHFKIIYWVWVKRRGDELSHGCDCPHFDETGKGCEHLWALKILLEPESEEAREIEEEAEDALVLRWRLLPSRSLKRNRLALELRDQSGQVVEMNQEAWARVENEPDIRAVRVLADEVGGFREARRGGGLVNSRGPFDIESPRAGRVLLAAAATGRLEVADENEPRGHAVAALPGPELELVADIEAGDPVAIRGRLDGPTGAIGFESIEVLVPGERPWVVVAGTLHPLRTHGAGAWARTFRKENGLSLARAGLPGFLADVARTQALPRFAKEGRLLPLVETSPRAELRIRRAQNLVDGELLLFYGDVELRPNAPGELALDSDLTCQARRERRREARIVKELLDAGFEADTDQAGHFAIPAAEIVSALEKLIGSEISLRSAGQIVRPARLSRFKIESGGDWFDLQGEVRLIDGGKRIAIGRLLDGFRGDQAFLDLDGESILALSAADRERLANLAVLGAMAEGREDGLRFSKNQALLADLFLGREKGLDRSALESTRRELEERLRLEEAEVGAGFHGDLRPYQKIGLAWLEFVEASGLGACLADEMGLGKTVQVLAFAEKSRGRREAPGPMLVVAPLSLLANWEAEISRFLPGYRVALHMGTQRDLERSLEADVVLTSYGTLRRDVESLSAKDFDLIVLDEAQAIKNRDSQTAEAARRLRGRFRIAMTGTPVENRLDELWSLFEFLAPALFLPGRSLDGVRRLGREADPRDLIRALRPIMLRRRKEEVLDDLPELVEQTILCSMTPGQEELYQQLLESARADLGRRSESSAGPARVLETLLRLRQIACHPRLVAPESAARSGKIDTLVERLLEAQDSGRKALVFSQFTSLLDIVATALSDRGLETLRLDGRVRNRDAVVRRFQESSEALPLLISLKVGGTGLNLTAAEEVFVLDPWWNPAVEAQAIARAHRIGQTSRVHALRLVSRGSIEEGILRLQEQKRELADAIVGEAVEGMGGISSEDLSLLLSG